MATYLIAGASRGLGLEMTRQLRAAGHDVIATVRKPDSAAAPEATGARVELLDTTNPASVETLARQLSATPVDVLIVSAGVFPDRGVHSMFETTPEQMLEACRVNVVGPMLLTRAMVPNLERSNRKLAVQISSYMGSCNRAAHDKAKGHLAYRSSKAALNMTNIVMACELAERGISSIALHPGWVRTEMGGEQAPLGVEEAVQRILATVSKLTAKESGKFLDLDGNELPW
ncbi:MAG: SDR family oxidoreductase [Planctomycetota bacterium]|nr:MAG: SDR family oxidoreductase [Planctomycetota bacterium]